MRVRILYFAVLRDITGRSDEVCVLTDGTTPQMIWSELRSRHSRLHAWERLPLTVINEEYADDTTPLRDGDELAFIPPVAGG